MANTDSEHTVSSTPPRRGKQARVKLRNLAGRTKAVSLLAVLLVGVAGGFAGAYIQDRTADSQLLSSSVGDGQKVVTSESQLVSSIAKNVGQSVVSINVSVASQGSSELRRAFGLPERQATGAGTGIIISKDGLVLTNRHVVPAGTTQVGVTLSDGTELDNVKVIGRTSDSDSLDIAVLKIEDTDGKKLVPAKLGDSSKVAVGDEVVAIGNALGQFQNTITTGIISGYGRSITAGSSDGSDTESLDNLFQTDAAINEGNSGGPLVNLNGQVIGVNTAIATDSQNIGFAIPINDVKGIVERVAETGKFERPYIGVRYVPLSADIAKEYNLSTQNGAYVAPAVDAATPSVVADSPASRAGLKEGDIITKVGGKSVNEKTSLTSLLGQYQPGDKVNLTVVNGKNTRSVGLTLGTAPTQ